MKFMNETYTICNFDFVRSCTSFILSRKSYLNDKSITNAFKLLKSKMHYKQMLFGKGRSCVLILSNILLSVNLSIADTMVSSLNVTFNFVYMLNGHWPFGNIYCKLCSYISIISVCGSVFTLVAISADR